MGVILWKEKLWTRNYILVIMVQIKIVYKDRQLPEWKQNHQTNKEEEYEEENIGKIGA
jgi:hypothetical protein